MEVETLDLKGIQEYMIGYYIVFKIYEIRDYFIFADERIDYNYLTLNLKILDYIREVNFIFIKDVEILENIKEKQKVGNLMNFQVFLDPSYPEDLVTLSVSGEQKIDLKIIF